MYAVDSKSGLVGKFSDSTAEEVDVTRLFRVEGGFGLECINE